MISSEQPSLTRVIEILLEAMDPGAINLFGSRVKGDADPHADYDIAVDAAEPSGIW